MSIIWKRPDGTQNANPEDFRYVQLSSGDKIWVHKESLHKSEHAWYPFQLGGDWSREEETKRLNRFVNMLDAPDESWQSLLMHINDDDMDPQGRLDISETARSNYQWVESLEKEAVSNTWEINIVRCALKDIKTRLKKFF